MHTLINLFPPNTTPDDGFKPLSHTQFFKYFLVPHVAAALIAQDLNTSLPGGYYCMMQSSDLGELHYPVLDEDEELDEIHCTNMILFKRIGRKPISDCPQPRIIPSEDDVEQAANLLLRLKQGPGPEVRSVIFFVSDHAG